ncbi:MAG: hypothetical protein HUU38_07720 [Anaerolineales bacterium]|nr:hypothetical protein [Anaerolineales bacterium]
MSYDVHIVRTDHWLDADSNPIFKEEVDKLVKNDKELSWSTLDFVEFATEQGNVERYFAIQWKNIPTFYWMKHEIKCSNPSEPQIIKMIEMATHLKARVVGDDGETYQIKKKLFGKPELITV